MKQLFESTLTNYATRNSNVLNFSESFLSLRHEVENKTSIPGSGRGDEKVLKISASCGNQS